MATVKSLITKNVSTALTTAYTNSSGGNATLKAINVTGVNTPQTFGVATTGAQEWTYFGTPNTSFNPPTSASGAHGVPLPVRLSADRVLLLWLPHHMHVGGRNDFLGGGVIHTQIVQYSNSAYSAGPIVNVALPTSVYTTTTDSLWRCPGSITYNDIGQASVRAVALTATKVVLAYRYGTSFRLVRLNITGNSVDQTTVVNVDLTTAGLFNSTAANAFDLALVPDDTTKVIVGGAGSANWLLQAFNVPDSGAMSTAGALTNTGMTVSSGAFTIAQLNRTAVSNVTTYVVAGVTTANTVFAMQNVTFNSTTNNFTLAGASVSVTATTAITSMQAGCVSSDGTANAVVAYVDSTDYNIRYYRQTSLTAASNTLTGTLTMQSSMSRGFKLAHSWGNSKSIMVGEGALVMFDSTGGATNLVPATQSTSTAQSLFQWLPFDSRPLYSFYDPATTNSTRVSQYYSLTGFTSTTAGTTLNVGNYLPWGHNYGGHYGWSEAAQCWVVGFGGRIYMLDTSGVVLNEIALTQLSPTFNYYACIKQLAVSPSGKIIFITDSVGGDVSYFPSQVWTSQAATNYCGALQPVTASADLSKAVLTAPPVSSGAHVVADLVAYTDLAGTERAVAIWGYSATSGYYSYQRFDGASWTVATNVTSVTSTTVNATWNTGFRPNVRLLQSYPADPTNPTGLWRLLGGLPNTQANTAYLAVSTVAYAEASFGSLALDKLVNNTTAATYAITRHSTTNMSVAATYDPLALQTRVYASVNGRLMSTYWQGWTVNTANTNAFNNVAVTKAVVTVSACNTSSAAATASTYVFDNNTFNGATAKYTTTTASGNGWVTAQPTGQSAIQVYGSSVNNVYTCAGLDTTKVFVTLNDGTNDFYITPSAGQPLRTDSSYRSSETYLVPNGYSVKLRSMLPNAVDSLLTIVEEA